MNKDVIKKKELSYKNKKKERKRHISLVKITIKLYNLEMHKVINLTIFRTNPYLKCYLKYLYH